MCFSLIILRTTIKFIKIFFYIRKTQLALIFNLPRGIYLLGKNI